MTSTSIYTTYSVQFRSLRVNADWHNPAGSIYAQVGQNYDEWHKSGLRVADCNAKPAIAAAIIASSLKTADLVSDCVREPNPGCRPAAVTDCKEQKPTRLAPGTVVLAGRVTLYREQTVLFYTAPCPERPFACTETEPGYWYGWQPDNQ